MTEQEILGSTPALTTSTLHPAWPSFVAAMAECQYGQSAIANAWAWFQDGFMKGRAVAMSYEIRCCVCAADITVKSTIETNGVVSCEGCGSQLAWFIPFAAELTGGVIHVAVLQIPEPGPSEKDVAALIKGALDPNHPQVRLTRDEVAAWIRNLPSGVDDPPANPTMLGGSVQIVDARYVPCRFAQPLRCDELEGKR